MLILVSGPSGVGKSTIIAELQKRHPNLKAMKTCTTRPARENADGAYYHVSKQEFEKMIENGELFEYENVHADIFYGTPFSSLQKVVANEYDYIKDVDVYGTKKIKDYLSDKGRVIAVFLDSPDDVLKVRLEHRGESTEMIKKRIARAEMERSHSQEYDVVIENEDVEATVDKVENFIGIETFK